MNIIHFTGMRSNKYGALEKDFVELAKQCCTNGYRLTLVYESYPESKQYIKDLNNYNVEIVIMSARTKAIKFSIEVFKLLNKEKPAIVHCHFNPAAKYVIPISYFLNIPTVQTFRSMPGDAMLSRWSSKLRCRLSTKVLAVSKSVSEKLIEITGAKNISVCYTGITFDYVKSPSAINRKTLNIPNDNVIIANVAFHADIKGVDVLLNALSELVEVHPNVTLIQMGTENNVGGTDNLKNLAKKLGLEDNIIWTGATDYVHDFLELADIYCQTSRSEGFGLAIIEAMTHNLPVIATNVGGIPEIIENESLGYLLPSEDVSGISDKMRDLINNEEERVKVGQTGKKHVFENFCSIKQTRLLVNEYESMQTSGNI